MPQSVLRYVLAAAGICGSLALTMCGGGATTTTSTGTSCQNGICGPGSTGTGGTSASGTGGSSTTGNTTSSTGGGGMTTGSTGPTTTSSGTTTTSSSTTSSSGGCTPAWVCTPWDTGVQPAGSSNAGTRTCTDKNHCNTTVGEPVTTATLPHLDVNYFECNVEPILDKKCGMLGCHGTETGRALRVYAKARLRNVGATFTPAPGCTAGAASSASCIGSNSCPCDAPHTATEWQRNYDAARGFAIDAMGAAIPDEHNSDLTQQPVVGGKSHAGIHLFHATDPEDATIYNWLTGATLGSNACIGLN
jgi:hypothetical protein